MVAAIRQCVTVQPGGLIEVRSPDLPPGTSAEVIVPVEQSTDPRSQMDQMEMPADRPDSANHSTESSLRALDALQQGLALTSRGAAAWTNQARRERRAS